MKLISQIAKEESKRIFWVIQTIFGFVIARSFYTYSSAFMPGFTGDLITLTLALVTVYVCVLWSWVDFSFTLIVAPYEFKNKPIERIRFVSDLFIVLLYTYLLSYLDYINKNPDKNMIEFFVTFAIIFFGYAISGLLRIINYGRRASRIFLILIFMFAFIINAILYQIIFNKSSACQFLTNRVFFIITSLLIIVYRVSRKWVSKRKYAIAIDVDGVLANQIEGILPVLAEDYNITLRYNEITSWDLKINDTSIDKIILDEQKERSYILNMTVYPDAKETIRRLIKSHYIIIATARPEESDTWTKEWLNKNNISFDRYYNLKEGKKQNSVEKIDILIDDYIKNIKSFLKRKEGKAILFSQPWNQDRIEIQEYIEDGSLIVVNNWKDVFDSIQKLLG